MRRPKGTPAEWRDIPGYDGAYQISREGQVRTWRWRGSHYMQEPKLLTPYIRKPGGKSRNRKRRRYVVKLTDSAGRAKEVAVLRLMADTWPEKLGQRTGAKSRRRPVAKVNREGEAVAFYPSARKAAKANHMSYQAVLDRCNGKIKKPYALDGYTYEFCD